MIFRNVFFTFVNGPISDVIHFIVFIIATLIFMLTYVTRGGI